MENISKEVILQTVPAVKKRLMDFMEREKEIDNEIERIENIEAKMLSVSSPTLSDMPKSPNVTIDKMARNYAKKEELTNRVKAMIRYQEKEKAWVMETIFHLRKADEKAVIEMRYIDKESWPNVSRMLFGTKPDFEEKEDSYLRRTTKLHGRALINIAAYLSVTNLEQDDNPLEASLKA